MSRILPLLRVRLLVSVSAVLLSAARSGICPAQAGSSRATQSPLTRAKPHRRATTRSARVRTGRITAIDTAAALLTLKETSGKTDAYHLTDSTYYYWNRRAGQITDFKIGDPVVAHFRRARDGNSFTIVEMADPVSWRWLAVLKRETVQVILSKIDTETLEGTAGADALPVAYRLSDATRCSKDGKEAAQEDFKTGDTVYIVPRALPGGGIMARVVADTAAGAARAKEQLASSLHGVIKSIDNGAHSITFVTEAGDIRTLPLADTVQIARGSRSLPLSTLKPGQHVGARLERDDEDTETVWRITLETAVSRRKKGRGSSPGKMGAPLP